MSAEQSLYPRGRIALDSGDLIDVTNVKVDTTNNAKQIHTLRQKGAGFTLGVEETTVSFDIVCSENGEERNYIDFLKRGLVKQVRIKIPGRTMTVNGTVKQMSVELPIDDAIKQTVSFIGHMSD
jgi:hypothetical protein